MPNRQSSLLRVLKIAAAVYTLLGELFMEVAKEEIRLEDGEDWGL